MATHTAVVNHQLTTDIGQGVGFERTRKITGYLAPVNRFNNAKRAELKDRVLHGTISDRAAAVMRGISEAA